MTPIWLVLGISALARAHVVRNNDSHPVQLTWPSQYHMKFTDMSLTENVIETCEIWTNGNMSRVDCNNGSVKSIVKPCSNCKGEFVKYYVHPEASKNEEVTTKCIRLEEDNGAEVQLALGLPTNTQYFNQVGTEVINQKECEKFAYENVFGYSHVKYTVWATYDDFENVWIPVRFEAIKFYVWLGSKTIHTIMDFYDFKTSFSPRNIFSIEPYNCSEVSTITAVKDLSKKILFIDPEEEHHIDNAFNTYKMEFNRNYPDGKEHSLRKSIFQNNLRHVIQHNSRNLGYTLSINDFSDKTTGEIFKSNRVVRHPNRIVGDIPFPYDEQEIKKVASKLPVEYDARVFGLVTKVKSQDDCESSWTFAATAAAEGAVAKAHGKLISLSNQAVIDCAWGYGGSGCSGGDDIAAYLWAKDWGWPTEAEYGPYINEDSKCRIQNMTTYKIQGYCEVPPLNIDAIKTALVEHGPLYVSIHATASYQQYSSGIFYDKTCRSGKDDLNHDVVLVGYGERDGDTFWILKNSHGQNWGMDGFMYISTRDNNCGVMTKPTYVVMK